MDRYNHGSCMPILAAVGSNLHLGDLEATCRESTTTDGGLDASAVDCSTAAGMNVALACGQETALDTEFCHSACFAQLQPYYQECAALMPSYLLVILDPVIALMGTCGEGGMAGVLAAAPVCDIMGLMTLCTGPDSGLGLLAEDEADPAVMCAAVTDNGGAWETGCRCWWDHADTSCPCCSGGCCQAGDARHPELKQICAPCSGGSDDGPPPPDPVALCDSPCIHAMFPCAQNPMLSMALGADVVAQIPLLEAMCSSGDQDPGVGAAGDGVCAERDLIPLLADTSSMDACGSDLHCTCMDPTVREMLDCIDSPLLAASRESLVIMQQSCAGVDLPAGSAGAGDHMCNLMSASDLCDEQTLAMASSGAMAGADMCSHPCALEMIDCIDSPLVADDRPTIAALRDICNSESVQCLPLISNLDSMFSTACCSDIPCPNGPPPTCSTGCSAMFLPFWHDCGATITAIGERSAEFSATATAMTSFNGVCTAAHPRKGAPTGGGH